MSSARRFQLVRELGSGAFGTVFLAEMESIGGFRKRVALKLLRPEVEEASDASRRLRDEARLLGRLRHRNIVQVDDLVWLNGRWAVVMEYVTGQDLEVLLNALSEQKLRFPVAAALELGRAVATALDAAWAGKAGGDEPLRVVHRDIKPSNVRLTEDGEVKVLDFGIARAEFQGREAKTGRVRYGSLCYMSPERLLGGEEGPAGDVYAVGCLLYECLVGRALGRVELAPDKQLAQLETAMGDVRERLREDNPELADDLVSLLSASLAYEESARPSAAELARRLGELLRRAAGEDLAHFAQRVLPALALVMPGQPANGTLVEVVPDVRGGSATFDRSAPSIATDVMGKRPGSFATTEVLDGLGAILEPAATSALPPMSPNTTTGLSSADGAQAGAPSKRVALWIALGTAAAVVVVAALLLPTILFPKPTPVAEPAPPDQAPIVPSAPPPVIPVVEPVPAAPAELEPLAPTAAPAQVGPTAQASGTPSTGKPGAGSGATSAGGSSSGTSTPPPSNPVVTAPPDPGPVERVRSAKFTVTGATQVMATCGDRSGSGGSSALVRDFPAGSCEVVATIEGKQLRDTIELDTARGVGCTVSGEALRCQ